MDLQAIINEADVMVPNTYNVPDKISWLNAVNQEFFNVVKIPLVNVQASTTGPEYTLPTGVRAKNIDLVQVGLTQYRSLLDDNVRPGENVWNFDDTTLKITLTPAPYQTGLSIRVRYHRTATTTFTSSVLTTEPDAPIEYHWLYVVGLCSRIAKSMDDLAKANNYENDYRAGLNVAAANYGAKT